MRPRASRARARVGTRSRAMTLQTQILNHAPSLRPPSFASEGAGIDTTSKPWPRVRRDRPLTSPGISPTNASSGGRRLVGSGPTTPSSRK